MRHITTRSKCRIPVGCVAMLLSAAWCRAAESVAFNTRRARQGRSGGRAPRTDGLQPGRDEPASRPRLRLLSPRRRAGEVSRDLDGAAQARAPGRQWQIGGPWVKDAGDYSSTQGQVLYVPDRGFFPVDRVTIIEWSNGCFAEAPAAALARRVPARAGREEVEAGRAQRRGGHAHRHGPRHGLLGQQRAGHLLLGPGGGGRHRHRPRAGADVPIPAQQAPDRHLDHQQERVRPGDRATTPRSTRARWPCSRCEVNGKKTSFVHEWHDDHAWSLPSVGAVHRHQAAGLHRPAGHRVSRPASARSATTWAAG